MSEPIETKAGDWWEARQRGDRLPAHDLHPELAEDLAAQQPQQEQRR